mgnify:CR=1 FL=1
MRISTGTSFSSDAAKPTLTMMPNNKKGRFSRYKATAMATSKSPSISSCTTLRDDESVQTYNLTEVEDEDNMSRYSSYAYSLNGSINGIGDEISSFGGDSLYLEDQSLYLSEGEEDEGNEDAPNSSTNSTKDTPKEFHLSFSEDLFQMPRNIPFQQEGKESYCEFGSSVRSETEIVESISQSTHLDDRVQNQTSSQPRNRPSMLDCTGQSEKKKGLRGWLSRQVSTQHMSFGVKSNSNSGRKLWTSFKLPAKKDITDEQDPPKNAEALTKNMGFSFSRGEDLRGSQLQRGVGWRVSPQSEIGPTSVEC